MYRCAQYYPLLVTHVFVLCTPYPPIDPVYEAHQIMVRKCLPNFRYQEQFAAGDLETHFQSKAEIRQFLNALFGGRGPNYGVMGFNNIEGIILKNLPQLEPTKLMTEREMDYYVEEFSRHGLQGPLNWYRCWELNYLDELEHLLSTPGGGPVREDPGVQQDVLMILATRDQVLKPEMARTMKEKVPKLTTRKVDANHWPLCTNAEEVNEIVMEWLDTVVLAGGQTKSRL